LMLFTVVLLVGLAWAWAHGDLEWIKRLSQPSRTAEDADVAKPTLPPAA